MITKEIDKEGYNKVDNIQIQGDGSVICRLFTDFEQEEGVVVEGSEGINKETVLGFPAGQWPFELTEEEMKELKPVQDEISEG